MDLKDKNIYTNNGRDYIRYQDPQKFSEILEKRSTSEEELREYLENVNKLKNGVVAIDTDGKVQTDDLGIDGIESEPDDATYSVSIIIASYQLGVKIQGAKWRAQTALNATKQGLVILELVRDNCFVYLPKVMSKEQLERMINCITLKKNCAFLLVHGEERLIDVDYDTVIDYINGLTGSLSNSSKRATK